MELEGGREGDLDGHFAAGGPRGVFARDDGVQLGEGGERDGAGGGGEMEGGGGGEGEEGGETGGEGGGDGGVERRGWVGEGEMRCEGGVREIVGVGLGSEELVDFAGVARVERGKGRLRVGQGGELAGGRVGGWVVWGGGEE